MGDHITLVPDEQGPKVISPKLRWKLIDAEDSASVNQQQLDGRSLLVIDVASRLRSL